MNNFELHEKAQQLADTTSAYELARRLVEMEQDRDQLRDCFHGACEELNALKAALVDEGDETPVGPALSLVEKLKAERDGLRQKLLTGRDMYEGVVERCQDAEIQTSQVAMRLHHYREESAALAAHQAELVRELTSCQAVLHSLAHSGEVTSEYADEAKAVLKRTKEVSLAHRDAGLLDRMARALNDDHFEYQAIAPDAAANWLHDEADRLRRQAEHQQSKEALDGC